ncbi:MAG: histidine ammonia-lyase [Planctomycetota bacterium]|jgi:histidine ammonia-lyase
MGEGQNTIVLDTTPVTPQALVGVARQGTRVQLASRATEAITSGRDRLEKAMRDGVALYGVNTGFGSLSRQRIDDQLLAEIQRNLLLSHASSIGEPLPDDIVRGAMLLLAASLSRGYSGVRPVVVESLLALLNNDITPIVPETGSVGASGDLSPLSHIALVLLGEGKATHSGGTISGREALGIAGIDPLAPQAKEGLALINGTHIMASHATLTLNDALRMLSASLIGGAMSMDACRATDAFLDPRIHEIRCQSGQMRIAATLRGLLGESQIVPSHRDDDQRVQDPYSFRCMPQVLGAVLDTLEHALRIVSRELGGVTDNPLVCVPDESHSSVVVSGGNFHGMPLALALDSAAIAISHVAGMCERRIYAMLAAREPESGLPAHLSPHPGLHSGYMIVQYSAAACCNEIAHLASPASVINIPTCAGMEDYNSFGPHSAKKLHRATDLARHVVAMELLCASEALEHHRPLESGPDIEGAHRLIRGVVPELHEDRPPSPDIEAIESLIRCGAMDGLCQIPPEQTRG